MKYDLDPSSIYTSSPETGRKNIHIRQKTILFTQSVKCFYQLYKVSEEECLIVSNNLAASDEQPDSVTTTIFMTIYHFVRIITEKLGE